MKKKDEKNRKKTKENLKIVNPSEKYDASKIQVLKGLEAVRRRPAIFLCSY